MRKLKEKEKRKNNKALKKTRVSNWAMAYHSSKQKIKRCLSLKPKARAWQNKKIEEGKTSWIISSSVNLLILSLIQICHFSLNSESQRPLNLRTRSPRFLVKTQSSILSIKNMSSILKQKRKAKWKMKVGWSKRLWTTRISSRVSIKTKAWTSIKARVYLFIAFQETTQLWKQCICRELFICFVIVWSMLSTFGIKKLLILWEIPKWNDSPLFGIQKLSSIFKSKHAVILKTCLFISLFFAFLSTVR